MIRVNLLPQQYRKAEATPMKQFFATVGAAVIVTLAVVGYLYVDLKLLASKQQELAILKDDIKAQEVQVKVSRDMDAWLKDYIDQYEKIDKVTENRQVLSRKMDEFWELVVNPNPPDKYMVWLKGLNVALKPGDAKTGGTTSFAGVSAGPQMYKLFDFHEAIKTSEFYRDYMDITYPYGNRVSLTQTREPGEGWDFSFNANMKSLKDLSEARIKAMVESGGKK